MGAVYLYAGASRQQISCLTGSSPFDVFSSSVVVQESGDYVVVSP